MCGMAPVHNALHINPHRTSSYANVCVLKYHTQLFVHVPTLYQALFCLSGLPAMATTQPFPPHSYGRDGDTLAAFQLATK